MHGLNVEKIRKAFILNRMLLSKHFFIYCRYAIISDINEFWLSTKDHILFESFGILLKFKYGIF